MAKANMLKEADGMARQKIKAGPALQSWEEADAALREIAELDRKIADIEGEMNKQIDGIKITAAREAKPHQDRKDTLAKDLKEFAAEHREDFGDKKSRRLNFGEIGFRQSTQVTLPKDKGKLAEVIQRIKARRLRDCITVTESINKDILRSYGRDAVIAVGAGWKQTDSFWYEVAEDKLEALGE